MTDTVVCIKKNPHIGAQSYVWHSSSMGTNGMHFSVPETTSCNNVGNMLPLSLSQAAPKQACGSRHSSAHTAVCLHSGTLHLSRENITVQTQKYALLINVFR